MPSQTWLDQQVEGYDYLKVNSFKLSLLNLPHVSFYCQTANLPGLDLGIAMQPTPLMDLALAGEKMQHEDLQVQFVIDAKLQNWTELFNWIIALGRKDSQQEFIDLRHSGKNKSLSRNFTPLNEESGIYADATLMLLTGKSNPYAIINLTDIFPVRLSGIPFDATQTETEYMMAHATFKFKNYNIEVL